MGNVNSRLLETCGKGKLSQRKRIQGFVQGNRPLVDRHKKLTQFLLIVILAGCGASLSTAQQMSGVEKERARNMLAQVSEDIKKHYYDPKFHGVDWDAKVSEAKEKIDHSPSFNVALTHIAAAVDSLHDSHTRFFPPQRPYRIDFGYVMQIIGEKCFIVQVRPGSDAEAKGLKIGDEVVAYNGYPPDRDSLFKMEYVYRFLRPQPQYRFKLRSPGGEVRDVTVSPRVDVGSKVTDLESDFWKYINEAENSEYIYRLRTVTIDDVLFAKVPTFMFPESVMSALADSAKGVKTLIIDLRANGGGSTETLKALVGSVMDHDITIAERVGREKQKPFLAPSKGKNAFSGKLIVLVDSESASASELFSRIIQLEKRGIVIGDQSAGMVMEAQHRGYQEGTMSFVFFGAEITDADLLMSDGKSLENVGVTPDEVMIPTAQDLDAKRDPVLARAAELAGIKLTPEKAGTLFPFEWQKF